MAVRKSKYKVRTKASSKLRAHSPLAEAKYSTLRLHHSSSIRLDDVFDLMLRTHLEEEYGNDPETIALLKITGMLGAITKGIKWMSTKEELQRFYMLAQQERWDRKFPLTRPEAAARFITGKGGRKIPQVRPADYQAQPGTPYRARPGSSKGKLGTTQKGAVRVEKNLRDLFDKIFSMGDAFNKKKVKHPKINIQRIFKL